MDDIDGTEMHAASKSASSGRRKIPIAFYLKTDRFGDFWASEWFESIPSDLATCRAVVASGQRRAARRRVSGLRKCQKTLDFSVKNFTDKSEVFCIFENNEILVEFKDVAPSHRWSYSFLL